jgi:hypothetical protein
VNFANRASPGTYTLILSPQSNDKGAVTLALIADVTGTLTVDGVTPVNLSAGRSGHYSFTAEAGKGYGLALPGYTITPTNNLFVTLRLANGPALANCTIYNGTSTCTFAPSLFAAAGTYMIDFVPGNASAATFNASFSKDTGGALTVDASATTMTVAREGQNGRFTFSGTAGDLVNIVVSDMVGFASVGSLQLYRPSDGASIASMNVWYSQGGSLSASLPQTGTYTFLMDPGGLDKGSMHVAVKSFATGPLTVDGSTAINLSAGRTGRYSFTAEAGKGYGLALPGYTITPTNNLFVTLRGGDGTALSNCTIYNGTSTCTFAPSLFAAAGTYMIDFVPGNASAATFNASFSKDTEGALTIDAAATTVTIAREGQNGRFTFSGTTGQSVSIVISNMVGFASVASLQLYRPSDGASIASVNIYYSNGGSLTTTLPQTGTYTFLMDPGGLDTGSMNVRVIHN